MHQMSHASWSQLQVAASADWNRVQAQDCRIAQPTGEQATVICKGACSGWETAHLQPGKAQQGTRQHMCPLPFRTAMLTGTQAMELLCSRFVSHMRQADLCPMKGKGRLPHAFDEAFVVLYHRLRLQTL